MADVVLKNEYGEDVTYSGVETVTLKTADGGTATFSLGGSTGLPEVTEEDNGKHLVVVEGIWQAQMPESNSGGIAMVIGTEAPTSAGLWFDTSKYEK